MKKNKLLLITVFISFFIQVQYLTASDEIFNPFEDESPRGAKNSIVAARGYLITGCLPDAIKLYRDFFGSEIWNELEPEYAFCLGLSGFYEEALLYLDNARKKDPQNPASYFYAGMIYLFSGFSDIALEMLKTAGGEDSKYDNLIKKFLSEKYTAGVISFASLNSGLSKLFNIDSEYGVVVLNTYPGPFISDLKNGDLILSVNGKKIETAAEIKNIINSSYDGATLKLDIIRNGKKINLPVKVFSKFAPSILQDVKMSKEPEKKDMEKLAVILSLMSEQNYFTAIYIYRKLLEKYPGWDLLYTGSVLALANTGAIDTAIKYAEKALLLTQDKENKIQLRDKLNELKSMKYEDKKNWRSNQQKPEKEGKRNFFIGFGGGSISIGGDAGFSAFIKARAGLFMTDNIDFSTDLSYGTESGFGISLNFVQRYYFIENISLNYGIIMSYNTSSSNISAGISGGGSYYTDRDTSYDGILSLLLLPSQDITFYLGMTRYF